MEAQYIQQYRLYSLAQLLNLIVRDYREKKEYLGMLESTYNGKLTEINADCRRNGRRLVRAVELE